MCSSYNNNNNNNNNNTFDFYSAFQGPRGHLTKWIKQNKEWKYIKDKEIEKFIDVTGSRADRPY